jgi:peptide/nickel transport system substrate-binding protein
VPKYEFDPERAGRILDAAGYPPINGVRFHLVMKTSTEETTRLMVAVLQQQLRGVGIVLDIRAFEPATFMADVVSGAYQMYSLRWIGGNEDPDIFEYVFHSDKFPPHGANRSFYVNPRIDALIKEGRSETDPRRRKAVYAKIQMILATDLPYINLWFLDNVIVHTKRVHNITLNPSGNCDFLKTAALSTQ